MKNQEALFSNTDRDMALPHEQRPWQTPSLNDFFIYVPELSAIESLVQATTDEPRAVQSFHSVPENMGSHEDNHHWVKIPLADRLVVYARFPKELALA